MMVKSRTESPEIRKRQILDAARVLLSQRAFEDIRMEDVSRKAQLAKGTLYLHFKDKSQIMVAVHDDLLSELELILQGLNGKSGVQLLEQVAKLTLEFLRKNNDFFLQFSQTRSALTGTNRTAVLKRFQRHMDLIKSLISKASEKGEIPAPEGYIGTLFFISLIRMFWEKSQLLTLNESGDDVDVLMSLFLGGIQSFSNKGKKS